MRFSIPLHYLAVIAVGLFLVTSCSPSNPRQELNDAVKLMKAGDYEAALPKTALCLGFDKDNVDAIILNTQCVYAIENSTANERKAARLNLQRVTGTLDPDRFDALFTYASILIDDQDFDTALSVTRKAREIYRQNQTDPTVTKNDSCDADDKRLAKLHPEYARLLFAYAYVCCRNQLAEGLEYCQLLSDVDGYRDKPELYLAQARLERDCKGMFVARKTLSNAINLFPENLQLLWNYALADEAIKLAQVSGASKLTPKQLDLLLRRFYPVAMLANQQNNQEMLTKAATKYNMYGELVQKQIDEANKK